VGTTRCSPDTAPGGRRARAARDRGAGAPASGPYSAPLAPGYGTLLRVRLHTA